MAKLCRQDSRTEGCPLLSKLNLSQTTFLREFLVMLCRERRPCVGPCGVLKSEEWRRLQDFLALWPLRKYEWHNSLVGYRSFPFSSFQADQGHYLLTVTLKLASIDLHESTMMSSGMASEILPFQRINFFLNGLRIWDLRGVFSVPRRLRTANCRRNYFRGMQVPKLSWVPLVWNPNLYYFFSVLSPAFCWVLEKVQLVILKTI